MDEKPKRRWPRFGLKTLFVLVAVICVCLGSVTNEVRDRRAALAELRARGVLIFTADEWSIISAGYRQPIPTIPQVRGWLGDEAIQSIQFLPSHRPSQAEQSHLRKLFPEALVTFAIIGPDSFEVL